MENDVFCDELVTSLTSFLRLYGRHAARLQSTSQSFALTAAQLDDVYTSAASRALFAVLGGGVGAACGGLSGAAHGALGTIAAVTWCRLCDGDINAVGATVGFLGGVLGGAAGGVFGGTVGSVVGVAGTCRSLWGLVSNVSSLTIGFAAGAAAGGAIGGGFGALSAANVAVRLVGSVAIYYCGTQKPKEQKTNLLEKAGDFGEAIEPLVEELKTIRTISDKMTSSVFVRDVAGRTTKTLASVSAMEKTMEAYRTTNLLRFVQEAATQCKKITEELETTRADVEKCLTSAKKQKLDKRPENTNNC